MHEAIWEDYEDMNRRFPEFHLENKVNLEKECNDKPSIIHQYTRRGKKNQGAKCKYQCRHMGVGQDSQLGYICFYVYINRFELVEGRAFKF